MITDHLITRNHVGCARREKATRSSRQLAPGRASFEGWELKGNESPVKAMLRRCFTGASTRETSKWSISNLCDDRNGGGMGKGASRSTSPPSPPGN